MDYPRPFNTGNTSFTKGDRVIDQHGKKGVILGHEDFIGYEQNRPDKKWELIGWDEPFRDQYGNMHGTSWTGNIWIKKL